MPAAAEADDLIRFDRIDDWPAPEEQPAWFGSADAERTLLDAYRSGRMHHAWMIGGPKGIGKATLAFRFARFVLAHPDPRSPEVAAATDLSLPQNHPAFRKVASRAHPNLLVMERPYDETNKRFKTVVAVDEIRKTVSFFGTTGGENNWRVAIVDPADDMNPASANALLKILEEPPARSLFLLVSHAPGQSLPTIRSRTRRLEVAPLPNQAIVAALHAHGDIDEDIDLVAALAEGSLRRAILLIDGGGVETYRAMTKLLERLPNLDMDAAHAFADRVSGRGDDDAWAGFIDMLGAWLDRRVRGEIEPESKASPPSAVAAVSLERWAEVWETLRRSTEDADEYNLDRKRTVLSILMALARATRM